MTNASQQNAIEAFRRYLESSISQNDAEKYGRTITRFDVEATDYNTLWITAEIENIGLPTSNALRAFDRPHYHVAVGKRGSITIHSGPASLEQFAGDRFLGFNISNRYSNF